MNLQRTVSIFIATMLFATAIYAQNPLKYGVYNIAGSVGFSVSNNDYNYSKSKYTTVRIEPSFGYFLSSNFLVSGRFSFVYAESDYSEKYSNYAFNSHSIYRFYEVGTSARYYFNSEKIIPFIGVGVFYSKEHYNSLDGRGINFSTGLNYFLSKEIALEPYVSYSLSSYNRDDQTTKNFRLGVSINYYIIQ